MKSFKLKVLLIFVLSGTLLGSCNINSGFLSWFFGNKKTAKTSSINGLYKHFLKNREFEKRNENISSFVGGMFFALVFVGTIFALNKFFNNDERIKNKDENTKNNHEIPEDKDKSPENNDKKTESEDESPKNEGKERHYEDDSIVEINKILEFKIDLKNVFQDLGCYINKFIKVLCLEEELEERSFDEGIDKDRLKISLKKYQKELLKAIEVRFGEDNIWSDKRKREAISFLILHYKKCNAQDRVIEKEYLERLCKKMEFDSIFVNDKDFESVVEFIKNNGFVDKKGNSILTVGLAKANEEKLFGFFIDLNFEKNLFKNWALKNGKGNIHYSRAMDYLSEPKNGDNRRFRALANTSLMIDRLGKNEKLSFRGQSGDSIENIIRFAGVDSFASNKIFDFSAKPIINNENTGKFKLSPCILL